MKKYVYQISFFVLFLSVCVAIPLLSVAGVGNTKHNLSASGPGGVKAVSEDQICIFCHTPHNAFPATPLWNHELTYVENYVNYWSPTLKSYASEADAPPIDGFSRLCLSCHDGTVALGAVVRNRGGEIEMSERYLLPTADGYLGTDLSGGHPVSIVFDEALQMLRNSTPGLLQLNWPVVDTDVRLYPTQNGRGVQCTSCHDPHGGKGIPGAPPFWRKQTYDDVCLVCHDIASSGIGH